MTLTVEDRLQIHELLGLHGHLMDDGMLSDSHLGALFTSDVRCDVSDMGGGILTGCAAIRDAATSLGEGNPVAHLVTNIVVASGVDDDHASARSKGLGVTTGGSVGSVTYIDDLVRTPVGWRIERRRVIPRRRPLTA